MFSHTGWGYYFFYFTPTYLGYIANVSKGNEATIVLVVDDLSSYRKPRENLFATPENEETIFQLPWYVPAHQLKFGQKVKVYFNGEVVLTAPGRAEGYWIETMK